MGVVKKLAFPQGWTKTEEELKGRGKGVRGAEIRPSTKTEKKQEGEQCCLGKDVTSYSTQTSTVWCAR